MISKPIPKPWCKYPSGGLWLDEEVEFDISADGSIDELCSLYHPVFPRALPIEMKGIAV